MITFRVSQNVYIFLQYFANASGIFNVKIQNKKNEYYRRHDNAKAYKKMLFK